MVELRRVIRNAIRVFDAFGREIDTEQIGINDTMLSANVDEILVYNGVVIVKTSLKGLPTLTTEPSYEETVSKYIDWSLYNDVNEASTASFDDLDVEPLSLEDLIIHRNLIPREGEISRTGDYVHIFKDGTYLTLNEDFSDWLDDVILIKVVG